MNLLQTQLQWKFDQLTEDNFHTQAAMEIAHALGGDLSAAYLVVLQEIMDRHELAGSIDPNDQKMRDAISNDLQTTARLKGFLA